MSIKSKVQKSSYHLLLSVIPIVIAAGVLKVVCHFLEWEVIPKDLSSFFPSILTGIIFILGFLLAGIVSDFKESERIPNDIAASLYAIWQEADYLQQVNNSKASVKLKENLKRFTTIFKEEFIVKQNKLIFELLNEISADIIEIGKEGATPNYMIRMKSELANIKKQINRILVIKNTDFVPSVFICIKIIAVTFLAVYSLLAIEPWWGGLILVCIFTFVIFSIMFLIKDMEDPFEYDGSGETKSDEISFKVLDELNEEFK